MNPIQRAILQQEIIEALKALYTNGQVGHIERQKVLLDVELVPNNVVGTGTFYGVEDTASNLLEVGKTYTVTTDSGTYTSVCQSTDATIKYLGNMELLDGNASTANGSFLVLLAYEDVAGESNAGWALVCLDGNYGSHMKIVGDETIHPIDPKFLPGVCLPVVELSTTGDMPAQDTLTEDAVLVLINAVENGTPLIARASLTSGSESLKINMLCSTMHNGLSGSYFAQGTSAGISVTMEAVNGTGTFAIESMV